MGCCSMMLPVLVPPEVVLSAVLRDEFALRDMFFVRP